MNFIGMKPIEKDKVQTKEQKGFAHSIIDLWVFVEPASNQQV
jgi:hypothetical protein